MVQDCSIPLAIPFSKLTISAPVPDKRPIPGRLQSVGGHIKTYRLKNRIPIKDIISSLKIDRETLRGWESNQFQPYIRHYPLIIQLLGYFPLEIDTGTLSGKIKNYRHYNGLSQRQFAKLLDTDVATVWQWETKNRPPLLETQKKILALIE